MNRNGVENISAVYLPTTAGFVRRSAQRQQAVSIGAKVRLAREALGRAVQTLSRSVPRMRHHRLFPGRPYRQLG